MKTLNIQNADKTIDVTIKTDTCTPTTQTYTTLDVQGVHPEQDTIGLNKFLQLGTVHKIGDVVDLAKANNLSLTSRDNSTNVTENLVEIEDEGEGEGEGEDEGEG